MDLLRRHKKLEQPRGRAIKYTLVKLFTVFQVFENFVQGSGDEGFIVFSMGSVVEAQYLPETLLDACIEAFSKIKQRVIWKFEKPIENITSNVMISKWIPQQDLMGKNISS